MVSDTIWSIATNARLATSEAAEVVRNRMLQDSSTYNSRTFITHRPMFLANVVACTAKPVAGSGVIQPSPEKLLFQQQNVHHYLSSSLRDTFDN